MMSLFLSMDSEMRKIRTMIHTYMYTHTIIHIYSHTPEKCVYVDVIYSVNFPFLGKLCFFLKLCLF